MKRIIFSILCLFIVTKLKSQEVRIPGITINPGKGSVAHTMEQKDLQIGNAFILSGSKPKNQLLKVILSFKPDKKTSERLARASFESLAIEYLVSPVGSEKSRKNYGNYVQFYTNKFGLV